MPPKERRLPCHMCDTGMAPLKLSNMYIDKNSDVKLVCSACIIKSSNRQQFRDAQPWPLSVFENEESTERFMDQLWLFSVGFALVLIFGSALGILLMWRLSL